MGLSLVILTGLVQSLSYVGPLHYVVLVTATSLHPDSSGLAFCFYCTLRARLTPTSSLFHCGLGPKQAVVAFLQNNKVFFSLSRFLLWLSGSKLALLIDWASCGNLNRLRQQSHPAGRTPDGHCKHTQQMKIIFIEPGHRDRMCNDEDAIFCAAQTRL